MLRDVDGVWPVDDSRGRDDFDNLPESRPGESGKESGGERCRQFEIYIGEDAGQPGGFRRIWKAAMNQDYRNLRNRFQLQEVLQQNRVALVCDHVGVPHSRVNLKERAQFLRPLGDVAEEQVSEGFHSWAEPLPLLLALPIRLEGPAGLAFVRLPHVQPRPVGHYRLETNETPLPDRRPDDLVEGIEERAEGLRSIEQPLQNGLDPENSVKAGGRVSSELLEPYRLDSVVENGPLNLRILTQRFDIAGEIPGSLVPLAEHIEV